MANLLVAVMGMNTVEPLNAEPLNAEPLNAEPLNADPHYSSRIYCYASLAMF